MGQNQVSLTATTRPPLIMKSLARKKVKAFVAFTIIGLLAVLTVTLLVPRESPRIVKSMSGHIVKLEAWSFRATPVRYDFPNRPWARQMDKWLPKFVRKRIGLSKPSLSVVASPAFPGEPVLSAAFSITAPRDSPLGALRVVVADDQGQEFDPAVQDANVHTGYWATEVRAFPRRSKMLRLRLVDNTHALAEFSISNPAKAPHPSWKPEPLPATVSSNGLELSLVKFRSYQSGTATFTKEGFYPRTQCSFKVRENGRDSIAWRAVAIESSDATGNHWQTGRDSRLEGFHGSEVLAGFPGALWPGEDAWKLRVEFKRVADFPENELVRILHIPIPGPDEILQPQTAYEVNGATVVVATVIGSKVAWERIYQFNPERVRDCVTVLIQGKILSQNRRVAFVEAKEDHGAPVKLEGVVSDRNIAGRSPDFLPNSLNFRPPQEASELTLMLAVSQSRVVEFLAKPEQVQDDGAAHRP